QGIMAFPSKEMYGGLLRANPAVASRTLEEILTPGAALDAPPVLFLDTAGKGFFDEVAPGTESHQNEGEAGLILAPLWELLSAAPRCGGVHADGAGREQ